MTAGALLLAVPAISQKDKPLGQGRAVVTILSKHHGESPASISQKEVSIKVNGKDSTVTSWTPLRGPEARQELVILIDSAARGSVGSQYSDIEHFVNGLPPNTKAAIAYMMNGRAVFVGPMTADHASPAGRFAGLERQPLLLPLRPGQELAFRGSRGATHGGDGDRRRRLLREAIRPRGPLC
jgi:hypothetical protein